MRVKPCGGAVFGRSSVILVRPGRAPGVLGAPQGVIKLNRHFHNHDRRRAHARRLIDVVGLKLAPAFTGGVIVASHTGRLGHGLIACGAMLGASALVERSRFPLTLMPLARVGLALLAPAIGSVLAFVIILAAGSGGAWEDVVPGALGASLVLLLGAWVRHWVDREAWVRIAVVGDPDFAADLAAEFEAGSIHDFRVEGWIGQRSVPRGNLVCLGNLREVRDIVVDQRIELIVCAPGADLDDGQEDRVFEAVADFCLDLPVRMMSANQLYEELLGHVPIGTIDAAWFRYIMHPRFRAGPPISKRIFDIVGAIGIGLLFTPILIAAAVAVKLGDAGPVIYRQRRVGEQGGEFEILKLRTMRVDAEDDGAARWSEADDPRVTRLGSILRRSHVDELPQLWNVLRGEMTLVGPRPERPEFVVEIERQFPNYARRHLVKPGMAGWAQLRCGYAGSDLGTAWKLCHDLYYVKHSSLVGDALILFETGLETFRDAHRSLRSPAKRFLIGEEVGG